MSIPPPNSWYDWLFYIDVGIVHLFGFYHLVKRLFFPQKQIIVIRYEDGVLVGAQQGERN